MQPRVQPSPVSGAQRAPTRFSHRAESWRRLRGVSIAHLIEMDGPGGAERLVALLAGAVADGGARSIAFLPEGGEGWLTRELRLVGITVEHVPVDTHRRTITALEAGFRRHDIAVAHSHEFAMGICGAVAARRTGAGHVITMHGGRHYASRWHRRLALRLAATHSGALVGVCREAADALRRDLWLPRRRVLTISNGVFAPDFSHPAPLRADLGLAEHEVLIVAVGNLYPVKGHRYLIEALALLRERHPHAHVAVVGRGELHEPLEALARSLGVSDRVHLLGFRPDVGSVLAAADFFALPSLSEGLPLALLEAMRAGLPIIASDVGGIRTALANGEAGQLVRPGDPQDLATALDWLLSQPTVASVFGARAEARAAEEYDFQRTADSYASLYATLLPARALTRSL
ncbi:MAG TPA: glycosyltransferase [Gemmatimonadales bacterium]|nr:glycosyltransferase [Gemmatimonadales bacterium]